MTKVVCEDCGAPECPGWGCCACNARERVEAALPRMTTEEIVEEVGRIADDFGEEILFADGFEDALIGTVEVFEEGGHRTRALYDAIRMREILMERDGMTLEDAEEYLDFNVFDAYAGPGTPAFAYLMRRG